MKSEIELKFGAGITLGITVVGVDHTAGPAALEGEFLKRGDWVDPYSPSSKSNSFHLLITLTRAKCPQA